MSGSLGRSEGVKWLVQHGQRPPTSVPNASPAVVLSLNPSYSYVTPNGRPEDTVWSGPAGYVYARALAYACVLFWSAEDDERDEMAIRLRTTYVSGYRCR